jgi:hypothetical protein
MFSVTFFLGTRHKTIVGKMPQDCWITFKKDFNEAIEEIVQVEIINPKGDSTLCEKTFFLNQYVLPENR